MATQVERLASLETEVRLMREDVSHIRATQLEIRDAMMQAKGGARLASLAWSGAKALGPTGVFAAVAHWAGFLRIPVVVAAVAVLAPTPVRAEPSGPPVPYCADVRGDIVAPLPAWREGAGYERQALFLPCVELAHEDDA